MGSTKKASLVFEESVNAKVESIAMVSIATVSDNVNALIVSIAEFCTEKFVPGSCPNKTSQGHTIKRYVRIDLFKMFSAFQHQ